MTQTFDAASAILYDEPEVSRFQAAAYSPLKQALAEKEVLKLTPCLVSPLGDHVLVIPTLSMVYHHVAQGEFDGRPWMMTLCALCNAGAVFDPIIDGQTHHFSAQGYHEAMTLIADEETGSYWNHLTGKCLYGPLADKQITRVTTLEQLTAEQALKAYPDAHYVRSSGSLTAGEKETAWTWNEVYRLADVPAWDADDELLATLTQQHSRLSRYDMGLGVWTEKTQRYYPILEIHKAQNIILDVIDNRKVLVTVNEEIGLPTIFYCDTVNASFYGQRLRLDDGQHYENGVLYRHGVPVKAERPYHSAIRWYGFSSLFPGCEIFGQK